MPVKNLILVLALLVASCTSSFPPPPSTPLPPPANGLIGVNLSGPEFGPSVVPGRFGFNYTYPTEAEMAYFSSKGFTLIRLPFLWERIQPTLKSPLDEQQLALLDNALAQAGRHNLKVILDVHNFSQYRKNKLGTKAVPQDAFTDLWSRLARHFKGNPNVWAYGLMNEPNGLPTGVWPKAAQAAILGIRKHDPHTQILVPGEFWSSALKWPEVNPSFPLHDPSNNLRYEAHTYFDKDNSGTYPKSYQEDGASLERANRLLPFVEWLKKHNQKGFVGEYGVPSGPEWQPILKAALEIMHANNIPSTYWSAGPWWGKYPLSIEPGADGEDRPQMKLLETYARRP